MTKLVTDEMMMETLRAAGLSEGTGRPGPAALASPSYMALESRSVLVDGQFVKRMHPEMLPWFDTGLAMTGARMAGKAGVGPEVGWTDAESGSIAMTALEQGWTTARQHHLQDAATMDAIMGTVRRLHAGDPLPGRFDPFAAIDAAIEAHGAEGVPLPDDILWLRSVVAQAEPLMHGRLVPCRNDGASSNILLGDDGTVMLVDFDRAGMNDPMYDVGCLLAELSDIESDMEAAFTAYAGSFEASQFARARLWSHVDDLLHGLWARLMASRSERGGVEWLKYGEWRLLRLRMMLRAPTFEEKIRIMGAAA